jgi:NAD(P)-dependent dehydrogenase (short-subunit alcohol dehydrogenase family)
MNASVKGKSIAVTGGFGVLGRAVGNALLADGARVALLDRASVPSGLPAGCLALGDVDLGQPEPARRALSQAASSFGGLHGLVNVAGGFQWETVEAGGVETWDRLYALNVRTALLASQAALPHLLASGSGRIVNVGALASVQAGLGMGAYSASKSALSRLTEAMAEEFKDRGITVNAVLPSVIDTPTNRTEMREADATRWVSPGALAGVILFLLSDASAPITGALIPVKGRV